jgi:hypothetical protein
VAIFDHPLLDYLALWLCRGVVLKSGVVGQPLDCQSLMMDLDIVVSHLVVRLVAVVARMVVGVVAVVAVYG